LYIFVFKTHLYPILFEFRANSHLVDKQRTKKPTIDNSDSFHRDNKFTSALFINRCEKVTVINRWSIANEYKNN